MFTTNIHAGKFEAREYGAFVTVEMSDGTESTAAVFLNTPAKCDELIKAAIAAKSMLLTMGSGRAAAETPAPFTADDVRAIFAGGTGDPGPHEPHRIGTSPVCIVCGLMHGSPPPEVRRG